MDKNKLEIYKQRLEKMQKENEELINNMDERGLDLPLQDSISELSSYDNHPADLGSEVFEKSKDLALRENTLIQLQKIKDALQKINEGTYGRCSQCGQEIPEDRLEAIPESTLCLKCRKDYEGEGDRHPRPLEEDVVVPPFGGRTHDQSERELGDAEDDNAYDGEDAWQEVARYGSSDTLSDNPNTSNYPDIYPDSDEDIGFTEDVDHIPYEKGKDGVIYEDYGRQD
ncbi:TraR/DksA C4-type zinc finger protein [Bacillota bacterium LX-D]|nr:TraR/DksA C4-type zinc finger protein [Bacillota bacterium LX-D]